MIVYADSSALVKLYVAENHSFEVTAFAQREDVTFAFNGLHDLEVRNAIRLLTFRGTINSEAQMHFLGAFDSDLATDLYVTQRVDFGTLTKSAQRLSATATAQTGARALDILHVAAASLADCAAFLTFDERQREVARVAGLSIATLRNDTSQAQGG
ncbi:MAG: type II toxin-antitoxin system VapC family toxin [Candidatus Eremiobacteraeota bacterium]|nr:type II toxin-antitoxin system VapC family toxin [Candidatus Eremiobacteraeota bacterium]